MQRHSFTRRALLLALSSLPIAATAAPSCADLQAYLADKTAGELVCFHSDDLRTMTPETRVPPITPPNNFINTFADGTPLPGVSVLGLPANFGSITPITDRGVISNGPTPTTAAVPGVQVEGWFADDPTHQARFVLRFPDDWNGKLVVAGASGTRSEYNGDYAWSDYVLPKGYAYASQNKGVLNFHVVNFGSVTQPANDPLSCRVNPPPVAFGPPGGASSLLWVHFYDVDPDKPFTQWTQYMLETASLAQGAVKAGYHQFPRRTYAVGTSNGGYQVRRAIEEAPNLFDGGVDWEGTYMDPTQNILVDLPPAVKNYPAYAASDFDPNSVAAQNILAAGYPPDIVHRNATTGAVTGSLWQRYYNEFWEVTTCQWQQRFDPAYATYTAGPGNYDYLSRLTAGHFPGGRCHHDDRQDQEAADHGRGHDGRTAADQASGTRLRGGGRRVAQGQQRSAQCAVPPLRSAERQSHRELYAGKCIPRARRDPAARAEGVRPAGRPCREERARCRRASAFRKEARSRDTPAQAGNCAQLLAP